MPVMLLPWSMRMAPSSTVTSASPPKLVDFQFLSVLPSKRDFHCGFLASPAGDGTTTTIPATKRAKTTTTDRRARDMVDLETKRGISIILSRNGQNATARGRSERRRLSNWLDRAGRPIFVFSGRSPDRELRYRLSLPPHSVI